MQALLLRLPAVLPLLAACLLVPPALARANSALPWTCTPWSATATPHATRRPAHAHRDHIVQQANDYFVRTYAACDEDFDLEESPITRCGMSQYAVLTYLCGKAVADTDGELPGFRTTGHLLTFVDWMENVVQTGSNDSCSQWPELVLRFGIHEATDPSLGHTFAVHFLPEGGVQVYQSFITHYTLHSYLASHGPLDLTGFRAFLRNIEVITNATGTRWPATADRAYRANFLVSLVKDGKTRLGPSRTKPCPVCGQSKASSSPFIKMLAERACLAAPWHGAPAAIAAGLDSMLMLAILPPFFGDVVGPFAGLDGKEAGGPDDGEAEAEPHPPASPYQDEEDYDACGGEAYNSDAYGREAYGGDAYGGHYANGYGYDY